MDNQPYVVEGSPGSQEIVMVGERPYTYARILTQQELSKIRSQANKKIGRTNTQTTSADKNPVKVKQSEKIIDHSASNEEMKIEDLEYDDHEEVKQNNDHVSNVVRPQNVSIVEGHIANPNTNSIGQYENDKDPFFTQVVHRFPKAIIWYFMVLTFTATRASTEFGIVMCYLSLIGRAVQVVGIVIKKPIISGIGYGLSLIILWMLFGNAMFYEAD